MQLSVRDVAALMRLSESMVYQLIQEDELPAERINDLYRTNPAELLEWATSRKMYVSPAIFQAINGGSASVAGLTEALQLGGVVYGVTGSDRPSLLSAIVAGMPLPDGFCRETLVELLLARESLGSTALGGGVAIPHPRRPMVLPGARRVVRLCFLANPIDYGAPDGRPVDTLFLMVCPTVRDHLQLLARLASVLREPSFQDSLRRRPPQEVILDEVRRIEDSFHHTASSASMAAAAP